MEALALVRSNVNGEMVKTVDARELHAFLGSKQEFATWVKAKIVNNPFFLQGTDFTLLDKIVKQVPGKGGAGMNRKDYALTLDTAKKVSMAEQTEAGNKARDYFLECEKVAKSIQPSIPTTMVEALALALELEKERVALVAEKATLEAQAAEDAPHVEFSKAIETTIGSLQIGEFAKVVANSGLKIGRNRLFTWLRSQKILMFNNEPYQRYIENEWFEVEEKMRESYNGPVPYILTKITGKGQRKIMEKLNGTYS